MYTGAIHDNSAWDLQLSFQNVNCQDWSYSSADAVGRGFWIRQLRYRIGAVPHGIACVGVVGLQWPDMDFRGRFITVRRQTKERKITRTKTKKMRKIDISVTGHTGVTNQRRRSIKMLAKKLLRTV